MAERKHERVAIVAGVGPGLRAALVRKLAGEAEDTAGTSKKLRRPEAAVRGRTSPGAGTQLQSRSRAHSGSGQRYFSPCLNAILFPSFEGQLSFGSGRKPLSITSFRIFSCSLSRYWPATSFSRNGSAFLPSSPPVKSFSNTSARAR
jgi:hypothetical protein